ncbi:MAG: VOC family protein [Candidatus Promineifilaceae bacterium]|jgi:predicted 3-demethylubiquinone-9 3-methyltransferase (glyoxalase superfamily)
MTRQKIVPHLWFNKEAQEAAEFYVEAFGLDSKMSDLTMLHDTPSGDAAVVSFQIWGYEFMAISAGPLFKFNPSISFMVNFDPALDKDAREHIDEVWDRLSQGGIPLMPLDAYPFSERFGWIQDKYGVTWQLIYTNPEGEERPLIIPSFLFVGDVCGRAEEATDYYLSVFKNSRRGALQRYPAGVEPDQEGTIMFTDFQLEGQWFVAMDSAHEHNFAFNEAISLMVKCEDQTEIDYYWDKLSAVPEAEQCGWVKDQFGVSWQIVPANMGELLAKNPEKVTPVMLEMKKIVISDLVKAGES